MTRRDARIMARRLTEAGYVATARRHPFADLGARGWVVYCYDPATGIQWEQASQWVGYRAKRAVLADVRRWLYEVERMRKAEQ